MRTAHEDFLDILFNDQSDKLVFRMLSKYAETYIERAYYKEAEESLEEQERRKYIDRAFNQFDRLAVCLNRIFDQFSVNALGPVDN
jgi:hypothetical protein